MPVPGTSVEKHAESLGNRLVHRVDSIKFRALAVLLPFNSSTVSDFGGGVLSLCEYNLTVFRQFVDGVL